MARNLIALELTRKVFAGGRSFGDVGPYERLHGKVHFAIDPAEPGLPWICDLDLAPRNAAGLVEFAATLDIVKPVDLARGNRRLLFEFSNRGGRAMVTGFNFGKGQDMSAPEHAGDGFLMRLGYSLVWCGWQGDLIDRGTNVVAYLPEAMQNGHRLRGKVRQEFSTIAPGILSLGTSEGAERGEDVVPYPVLSRATATLTAREYETDPRVPVPDALWELADARMESGKLTLLPSPNHLYIKGGFKPGWLYELIYETEGSRVMGLGFLGIRDLLSFLRFGDKDAKGAANPLAGQVEKAYGNGISLSGRVVREFIYAGWNEDAAGRKLLDAINPHTGSGRLLYNIRFSQPGRYPRQHEEHTWPAEYYPFTFDAVPDPFTGKNEGMWNRPKSDPLVLHTHTEGDYWKRHVSLTHTDPRDGKDVALPETVRMYNLTGSPHMARPADDAVWIGQLAPNTMSPMPLRRALLVAMDEWATKGTPPPPTMLPRVSDGTLIKAEEYLARYPKIPGVKLPVRGTSRLMRYDYGPEFETKGIVSKLPPEPIPGQEYPLGVSSIDADGNNIAGVRYPDVDAPLGTYNGWSLRKAGFAEGAEFWNTGSFVPFARTRAERAASGDPRPSIEERYANHDDYVQKVARSCEALIKRRLLLPEDATMLIDRARSRNPFDPAVPLGPLVPVLVAPGG
jgi:Alpha/beta hydrolase domain